MLGQLLLILSVTGHVFTKEPPDVECLVINLEHVRCSWTSDLNYTFSSRFSRSESKYSECATYLSENGTNTGCVQPYANLIVDRFHTFETTLSHDNQTFPQEHKLKERVKLNPPVNLTVKNGSDFNLWFYWNQTEAHCVQSEVQVRLNGKKWETSPVSLGNTYYWINLPSSNSKYELRVRSRVGSNCGESRFWSDWTEPVAWGNITALRLPSTQINGPPAVWAPLLYVVGAITLVVIVMLLLPHGRNRFLPLPIPKPALVLYDIEDWHQFSKGLKGNLNLNEHACPVSECCPVSESESESSTDGSTCTTTTDQTNCSSNHPVDKSQDLSTSCASYPSSSEGLLSSQEQEAAVEEQ